MKNLISFSLGIVATVSLAALDQDHDQDMLSVLEQPQIPVDTGLKATQKLPDLLEKVKLKTATRLKLARGNNSKLYLCETCHSRSLSLTNHYLPILHGQNQDYLLKKMQMFKHNPDSMHPFRSDFQKLESIDLVDISQFYAEQESPLTDQWVSTPKLENQVQQEKAGIEQCRMCHGDKGKGDATVPVISGQNMNYLAYRIREIARHHSRVHVETNELVNCNIELTSIRQSRELAAAINLVVNPQRVTTGENVYQQHCAQCHGQDDSTAPKPSNARFWAYRLRVGTQMLFRQTIRRHSHDFPEHFQSLSMRQRIDAFHYMIKKISLSAS